MSKYGIEATVQKVSKKEYYSLYIVKKSMSNVRGLIGPYMHKSMQYKLGEDKND